MWTASIRMTSGKRVKDEWEFAKMNPRMEDILDVLQIKNKPVVVKKKRGRPKKQDVQFYFL